MDFGFLLSIHSLVRWFILVALILILIKSYKGLKLGQPFSKFDRNLRKYTPILGWVQFILGCLLYSKSAFVSYFFEHFPETLSQREIRFFGIEHSSIMPIAILVLTLGAIKSIKQCNNTTAYKIWFRWTLISFILIISSIPWSFWPLVSRPLFRGF